MNDNPTSENNRVAPYLLGGPLLAAAMLGAMLTLAGVGVLLAVLVYGVMEHPSGWDDPDYVASAAAGTAVELLIEEGFGASRLDPDEPLLKIRTIVIGEAINERTARHVIERLLHLDALDPAAPIDLLITTNGGWKDSAFAMIDTMRRIDAPVNTIAVGGCYSAGSMILVAGTGQRSATPSTLLSIHSYPPMDNPPPNDIDPLDQRRFIELYEQHSRTPAEFLEVDEESQPYFDARQALEWGIIDKITEPGAASDPNASDEDTKDEDTKDEDTKKAAELREARRPLILAG